MATSKRLGARLASALFMAVCFIFAASSERIAADEDSPPPIFQVKFVPPPAEVRSGDYFELAAEFELAEGVHIYRDSTTFDLPGLQGARVVGIEWPKATPFKQPDGSSRDSYEGKFVIKQVFQATGKAGDAIVLKGVLNFLACKGTEFCFPPAPREIDFTLTTLEAGPGGQTPVVTKTPKTTGATSTSTPPAEKTGGSIFTGGAFRWFDIVLAFVLGIGISFTPCVLPMTPITSGIITSYARPGKVNAFIASLIYVLGIAIVYGILGAIVGMIGSTAQSAINSIYARAVIAAIFVALALSMFGLYEIKIPGAIANKAQALGGKTKKNYLGLFFLGAASAFVFSPCAAAPIAAVLSYVFKSGDWALGFVMLFAMAWGMGVLLILAGTFTGLIPRGGSWMLYVNTAFGLVMLWGALYFLSPWLPAGVYYLGIGLILAAGSVFMGGWDSLTPESRFGARFRRVLGLLMILFGFFFAFSGMMTLMGAGGTVSTGNVKSVTLEQGAKEVYQTKADFDAALASGQPVVLDVSADWCELCHELDKYTFSDPRVAEEMKRFKFVRVNFDKEKELNATYQVSAPPRMVIFGSDGKERTDLTFNGFKNAEEFLEILKKVK